MPLGRAAGQRDPRQPFGEPRDGDLRFQAGQRRAEAKMDAESEGEMRVRRAADVAPMERMDVSYRQAFECRCFYF